ncbi:hypothetical protein [Candidatus Magnetominusculus dajiuhuensis]|uniref:hypothetical protein n=1 Tax=Candidatus Magnetominusculus dajiuhuensis TaxID=3137712 RepID=UPI003B42E8C2
MHIGKEPVSVIDCIKKKYSNAIISGTKCYDDGKCVLYLDNCKNNIILKGEDVRDIEDDSKNPSIQDKVCDCLIIITKMVKKEDKITEEHIITHLVLVEIDDGENKKSSHAREQLIGGAELAKKIIRTRCNYIDVNYNIEYIFLHKHMRNPEFKVFKKRNGKINKKDIQIGKCGYKYKCTDPLPH